MPPHPASPVVTACAYPSRPPTLYPPAVPRHPQVSPAKPPAPSPPPGSPAPPPSPTEGRLTEATYAAILDAYRRAPPAAHAAVARATGVSLYTVQRLYTGPPPKLYPWARPIGEVLAAEAAAEKARALDEAARARRDAMAADQKARTLREEAAKVEEDSLRVLRVAGLRSAAGIVRLMEGIEQLQIRVGDQLKRGTDHAGNPIQLPIREAMAVIKDASMAAARVTSAVVELVQIERARVGLPGVVVGVTGSVGSGVESLLEVETDEDAEELLSMAHEALERSGGRRAAGSLVDPRVGARAMLGPGLGLDMGSDVVEAHGEGEMFELDGPSLGLVDPGSTGHDDGTDAPVPGAPASPPRGARGA